MISATILQRLKETIDKEYNNDNYVDIVDKFKNAKSKVLETIGKASFNIFLTQMVYFSYAENLIEKFFSNNILLINVTNITICLLTGLTFYYFEKRITKMLVSFL